MTADKSVFRGENFAGASGHRSQVKGVCESQWTARVGKSDSNERRRGQLRARVREADEEIQRGDYSSRFNTGARNNRQFRGVRVDETKDCDSR